MKLGVLFKSVLSEATKGGFLAFHGSPTQISKFVDDFVGGEKAVDQEGPGIYFTTSSSDAAMYGDFIYTVKLDGKRFLDDETSNDVVSVNTLLKLIKMAPDWKDKAQNYNENPERGAQVAAKSAIEYNTNEKDVFLQIWIDFYRYDSVEFVRNMVKLGYDGIVVNRHGGGQKIKHIIVYNPTIIKVTDIEYKDEKIS